MDASSFLSSVTDELKAAANDAVDAVKQDGSQFVDRVRSDLAGAVVDAGSQLVNDAAAGIAPKATATKAVPLNATRVKWIVAGVALLVVIVWLVARRRRKS